MNHPLQVKPADAVNKGGEIHTALVSQHYFFSVSKLSIIKIIFWSGQHECLVCGNQGLSSAVVLKWEPLGSLKEEFQTPGRKFVPGRNWGGKAVGEKTLSFYH